MVDSRGFEEGDVREVPLSPWSRRLSLVFWVVWVLLVVVMTLRNDPGGQLGRLGWWQRWLVSPLILLVLWGALRWFRRSLANGLRRAPGPAVLKYLVIGLPLTTLGNTIAISYGLGGHDLHPNLVLSALLWFGAFGGILLAWYALRAVYRFGYRHVFVFTGIAGVLVEQEQLVPKTLLSGDVVGAALLSVFIIGVYGIIFTSPWLIMPGEQLPRGTRQPGWGARVLFVIVPIVAFYLGAFAWFSLSNLTFGTHLLTP
jgi:hypothetical protein